MIDQLTTEAILKDINLKIIPVIRDKKLYIIRIKEDSLTNKTSRLRGLLVMVGKVSSDQLK